MKKRIHTALLFGAAFLSSLSLPATSMAQVTGQDSAMQQRVLGQLAEQVMRPMADDFAAAGSRLASASRDFCRGQAKLTDVQSAWRNTQSAW
jgi:predicted lipoprotein